MQSLAAAEADQIESHLVVLAEVARGRRIRRGIDHAWNTCLSGNLDELRPFHLPFGIRRIQKQHQRRAPGDGFLHFGATLDFDELHADGTHRVVVGKAMGLLDDDLGLHPLDIRQSPDLLRILPRNAGGRP